MITKRQYEIRLNAALKNLRKELGLREENWKENTEAENIDMAIVLGPSWGNPLDEEGRTFISFAVFPEGTNLEGLGIGEDEKRGIELGTIDGKKTLVVHGVVHMHESTFNPYAAVFVRMQIELLIHLGVKHLILAVDGHRCGSEREKVTFIETFTEDFQEAFPLFKSETCSPKKALDRKESYDAWRKNTDETGLLGHSGPYHSIRGPSDFRDRSENPSDTGGTIAGHEVKQACAIAALYPNVKVFALVFSTPPFTLTQLDSLKASVENANKLRTFLKAVLADLEA